MAEDDAQDRPVQDALGDGNPPNDKSQEGGDKPTSVKQSRKRTKTGCLTCRKRRIKCGEERPTCANCRKSKRNCEGYIQRVVFKEPVNTIRPPVPIASNFSSRAGNQPLNIAPKPSAAPSQTLRSPPDTAYPRAATFIPSTYHVPSGSHVQNPSPISPQNPQRGPYHNPPFNVGPVPPPKAQHMPLQSPPSDGFFYHNNTAQDPTMNGIFDSLQDTISPYPGNISWQYENPHTSPNFKEPNAVVMDMGGMASSGFTPDMKMDEEYSMTDDDDTESDTPTLEGINDHSKSTQNYLTLVSAQQAPLENYPRTFTSALPASDALTTYHPSANSSPLTDPTTAQIFYHFISVTGPSMSQFERNPVNVSWIYDSQPLPALQQHIWTCTMPTLALNNTALMHAMLALGSLHIAKLRNAPISAALKHYAIALRRVGKSVGLPGRRSQPETLAACMLLGYFEVWSADHQKWSNHLSGARQLIEEIDFADVARYVKSMKMQGRDPYAAQNSFDDPNFIGDTDGIGSEHAFGADVDENIVSALMGKQVSYLQYGSIQENIHEPSHSHKNYSRRDLEVYENQRDLFWWYCKQDVYQSLLGGGKLFMDYRRWSHCPPRAPIGRFDASYGTYDHLILLLGRLCDFASKDIKRKRRARKMNEPSEDTSMGDNETTPKARYRPRPPNARPGANDANVRPSPDAGLPMSAGVMPTLGGTPALPMGFTPSRTESPSTAENEELDMETATAKAEEEWNALLRAFLLLQDNFGPNFQSLGPEYAAPMQTPFGTALNYRSFPIACIWLNYYMGLIVLHRAHPSMPPFAIQAAMASAERTAGFANEIGRIACAISPGIATMTGVSPMIGAALIESAFCLFFAGIQYQDKQQRLWAVEHLHGIARLVGWESADAIAAGLEKTWSKAGESGNGAPWTITSGPRVVPRLDPEILVPDRRRVDLILEYNPERRLVVPKTDRAHYALGILGVEEDIEKLDLGND